MNIYINDIFNAAGEAYRLLHVDKPYVYCISMDCKNPLPVRWDYSQCMEFVTKSKLQPSAGQLTSNLSRLSTAEQAVMKRRWNQIKDLVGNTDIFDSQLRPKILNEHSVTVGATAKTLLANLRIWWLGGQVKEALIGKFSRCGRIDSRNEDAVHVLNVKGLKEDSQARFIANTRSSRGRKPKYGSHMPFSMTNADRKAIFQAAKSIYLTDASKTMRATTDYVLRKLYCQKDEAGNNLRDSNGNLVLLPQGERPTYDQVRYLLKKALPLSLVFSKRETNTQFRNNHAPNLGSVSDDCVGPADVYEIDATIVDLWLVAKAHRHTIIGKATLYLVVDRNTRLIVGIHISLENACLAEAKQAILSIASDWKSLCERYDVKYSEEDWPATGVLPKRIVGDRGEMINYESDNIAMGTFVPITNPPARQPIAKGTVECSFKLVSVPIKDSVPGYQPPSKAQSRNGKHYEKDAILTMEELVSTMLKVVKAHNNKPLNSSILTPEEVLLGVLPTPINLWNHRIASKMGMPARYSFDYLYRKLALTGYATVTVKGVQFKNCIYAFDEAIKQDWLTRASIHGSFDVPVTYSSKLVDCIDVHDPYDRSKTYVAKLTPAYAQLAGYSFAEVSLLTQKAARLNAASEKMRELIRVSEAEDIDEVVQMAKELKKESRKKSEHGSKATAKTRERQKETRDGRQENHRTPGVAATEEATPSDFNEDCTQPADYVAGSEAVNDSETGSKLMNDIYHYLNNL